MQLLLLLMLSTVLVRLLLAGSIPRATDEMCDINC